VAEVEPRAPRIFAVGGGKGGVGKSIVASNLAVALAATGQRTAVVDADLGGANLHTLFGVARPRATLADFVRGGVSDLADLLVPTSVPDVSLISGARALPDMANPNYAQKGKLLRHLRRLPVQHVVLDLGAGSAFNVVDFFLAADRGLVVVTPEATALDNARQFLKAAFFRSLREVACEARVRQALESVVQEARRLCRTPRELIESAAMVDAEAGRLLRERVRRFAPLLVLNEVQTESERRLGVGMQADCAAYLGAPLGYLGALDRDGCVPAAVGRGLPVLQLFPGSTFAQGIQEIADRLGDTSADLPALPRQRARAGTAPAAPPRPRAALPPLDLEQPGAYLRRCRETLGLPLSRFAELTRIRCLAEIEAERFERLPPQPYLAAQVRLYAQLLGIPEAGRLAARYAARAPRA
jgi:flagellar biosynthesis protein FlhG